jgi:hypothetical protein
MWWYRPKCQRESGIRLSWPGMLRRSRIDRARRSRRVTMTTSPSLTARSSFFNAGRLETAAEIFSAKVSHPSARNWSSCDSSDWLPVDTCQLTGYHAEDLAIGHAFVEDTEELAFGGARLAQKLRTSPRGYHLTKILPPVSLPCQQTSYRHCSDDKYCRSGELRFDDQRRGNAAKDTQENPLFHLFSFKSASCASLAIFRRPTS